MRNVGTLVNYFCHSSCPYSFIVGEFCSLHLARLVIWLKLPSGLDIFPLARRHYKFVSNQPYKKFGFSFGSVYGFGSRQYLAQFFNNKKCVQNLAFSMLEAALFPRKLASHFFILFFYYILCWTGSKSGSGTVLLSGSGSAKATSYSSCGSGFAKAKIYGSCVSGSANAKCCGSGSTTLRISGFY